MPATHTATVEEAEFSMAFDEPTTDACPDELCPDCGIWHYGGREPAGWDASTDRVRFGLGPETGGDE